MIRAILRNVQVGLIISASLLVVLAFQRLSLYSVPVLVGNIVHPGQPPSGDSKELVGHGHAHGQHRIFSTNVIEVGLFKFVVPFRWSSAGEEDTEEEAVRWGSTIEKRKNGRSKKAYQSGNNENNLRRPRNERARRNKPRNTMKSSEYVDDDKSHMLGASPPRLKPAANNETRNERAIDDPLFLLPLNETFLDSNVTALPARRLLETDKRFATWFGGWLSWKRAKV